MSHSSESTGVAMDTSVFQMFPNLPSSQRTNVPPSCRNSDKKNAFRKVNVNNTKKCGSTRRNNGLTTAEAGAEHAEITSVDAPVDPARPIAITGSSCTYETKSSSMVVQSPTSQSSKSSGKWSSSVKGELGSLSRPGSKKGPENGLYGHHSASHRAQRKPHHFWDEAEEEKDESSWWRGKTNFMNAAKLVTHNKERYLQATCQFVVLISSQIGVMTSPDHLVDWDHIEELRLIDQQLPSCPICLHPPTAAQITRCGHIYCYPCILHYAALSDRPWRKCPICFESIYVDKLRSVSVRPMNMDESNAEKPAQMTAGARLSMTLVRRHQKSMLPLPIANYSNESAFQMTHADDDIGSIYAKLVHSTVSRVVASVVDREQDELNTLFNLEKDEPEACFITQAVELTDGQPIYLSPLNTRQLIMEYGDMSQAPEHITGTILAATQYVMCAELRERYRHLAHLPMGTTFTFVEMSVDCHLLSKETIDKFAEVFSRRARERAIRARQETRRAERAEMWNKHLLLTSSTVSDVDRDRSPPPFVLPTVVKSAAAELQAAWTMRGDDVYPTLSQPMTISSNAMATDVAPTQSSPLSFAEMIRLGKPKLATELSSSSRLVQSASQSNIIDDVESEYQPPTIQRDWLGDALQSALTAKAKQSKNKKKGKK